MVKEILVEDNTNVPTKRSLAAMLGVAVLVGGALVGGGVWVGSRLVASPTAAIPVSAIATPEDGSRPTTPPSPAAATPVQSTGAEPAPAGAAQEPNPPNYDAIQYELDCPDGVEVRQAIDHDFTGDGRPEAIRVVHCKAGAGSPTHAVLAYNFTDEGAPELLQTLLYDYDGFFVDLDESVKAGVLSGTAAGYSSPDLPRCCPDLEGEIMWHWAGSAFVMDVGPFA